MSPLVVVLMGVFGLAVGSFVNVVIVRVPSGESLLSPPSKCPQCEAPIAPRDNIPIVSWLALRGRCRSCGEPIPAGYPLVEAANVVLWVLAAIRFDGSVLVAVAYAVLFSVLLALSVIDLELYILPNRITYPSILASLVVLPLLAVAVADDPQWRVVGALIGAVVFAGLLLVPLLAWEFFLHKEGMGMGDVKLAVLLGLWLGFVSPYLTIYALIASSLLGLVAGMGILLVRRESRAFPFGPYLALGTIVVILFSSSILSSQGLDDDGDDAQAQAQRTSFEVVVDQ